MTKLFSNISLIILSVGLCAFVYLSQYFSYEIPWSKRPNILIVSLMVLIGVAYLFFVNNLIARQTYKPITIVVLGLILRLLFLDSTPVYEDDFYRYFWDAELSSQGVNPYSSAPIESMPSPFDTHAPSGSEKLQELSYLDRVAYPTIRTIYPPLTQMFFAIAHWMSPADLIVWRLVLLTVDCIALGLLILLLRELGKNISLIGIYWLNPILIIETVGAAHMDVLLIPFLLGSALLYLKKRYAYSGVILACAVGIKLWPIILAPLLFRPLFHSLSALISAIWPFVVLSALFIAPQLLSRLDYDSGLVSYALTWNTNAFIYPLVNSVFNLAIGEFQGGFVDLNILSRLSVVVAVLGAVFYFLKNSNTSPDEFIWSMLMLTTVLLLFSPTGYPWYYLWMLPWLSCLPYKPILMLTATLPLYYLRYLFEIKGQQVFFNEIVVTIEFLPSIIFAGYCFMKVRRSDEKEAI